MTNQEIFDKVVAHLRKQKERSVSRNICLYRGPNGLKCAVGCLITDEAYSGNLEGKAVGAVEVRASLFASGVPDIDETINMLRRLQSTHDDRQLIDWELDFMYIADRHNLTYSPP